VIIKLETTEMSASYSHTICIVEKYFHITDKSSEITHFIILRNVIDIPYTIVYSCIEQLSLFTHLYKILN